MDKFLIVNKKKLFLLGNLLLCLIYPVSGYLIDINSKICVNIGQNEKIAYWVTTCNFFMVFSLIFFSFSFFSLLLLFIKKESVFKSWEKFTFIYLFIYLFIILITPWYDGDAFFSISKGLIAIALTIIYSISSLVLIIYKSSK